MSLYSAAQMGQQLASQQPGGVAYGHVPQQPNLGLGPNRYVPPTFNWGRGGLDGRQPQYNQMDWNQMQAYYMPQHQNSPFTGGYMGQLRQMLGMFGNQFGGPNRQPVMPQFGSYNPGFGGPTSFFDQQRSGSFGGFGDSFGGYIGDMRQRYPNADRIEMGIGDINVRGGGMGGGRGGFVDEVGGGGWASRNRGGMVSDPFGGFGGRGGYPMMPQFNPYMLARNNMMGMDFNQMFDPRYAMLFGMGGLGAMTPNGPQQQQSGLKPGQLGGGG